jgi:hypothetical protein
LAVSWRFVEPERVFHQSTKVGGESVQLAVANYWVIVGDFMIFVPSMGPVDENRKCPPYFHHLRHFQINLHSIIYLAEYYPIPL